MCRFPIRNPAHYRYNEIPLRCRKLAGESPATCKRPRKQSARCDLGYFMPKSKYGAGHTEETSQCRTALWSLPACLLACLPCNAIAGPETSNNSLSIAPHGGGESRVYWWFPSGVAGLASARYRSVDSRRRRSGRLLMDIVGCLPLRWCIIADDLAMANASARYLAPPRTLIIAWIYRDFKESCNFWE